MNRRFATSFRGSASERTAREALPRRFACFAICLAWLAMLAAGAQAQTSKVQQLWGDYFGLTQLGVVEPVPTEIGLSIEIQDNRRFSGTLSYLDLEDLIVAGTIAKSGRCQITADSEEARAKIHLDWQDHGGGAATLTGDLTLSADGVGGSGPVAFLRPFDEPGSDWGRQVGTHDALFTSDLDGDEVSAVLEIAEGARGILQATIDGWIDPDFEPVVPDPPGWVDPDPQPVVVGASSAGGSFVAVGVGSGANQIVTLTGAVTTDRDGQPLAISGSYVIEHTAGVLIDAGTFRVLLAQ